MRIIYCTYILPMYVAIDVRFLETAQEPDLTSIIRGGANQNFLNYISPSSLLCPSCPCRGRLRLLMQH